MLLFKTFKLFIQTINGSKAVFLQKIVAPEKGKKVGNWIKNERIKQPLN